MELEPATAGACVVHGRACPKCYGEIVSGSQRTSSYDLLICCCKESMSMACRKESFRVVSRLAKVRYLPHGGFGMGIERAVAWICGLEHVREIIPFARTLDRMHP